MQNEYNVSDDNAFIDVVVVENIIVIMVMVVV